MNSKLNMQQSILDTKVKITAYPYSSAVDFSNYLID